MPSCSDILFIAVEFFKIPFVFYIPCYRQVAFLQARPLSFIAHIPSNSIRDSIGEIAIVRGTGFRGSRDWIPWSVKRNCNARSLSRYSIAGADRTLAASESVARSCVLLYVLTCYRYFRNLKSLNWTDPAIPGDRAWHCFPYSCFCFCVFDIACLRKGGRIAICAIFIFK